MGNFVTAAFLAASLTATDWPAFRGVDGSGISSGFRLPDTLDPATTVWTVSPPEGASSPVSDGERVFVTGHKGAERLVSCYSASTGNALWTRKFQRSREEYFHDMHGPATPTPAITGRRLIVLFPDLGLVGLDVVNGKELWRAPIEASRSVQGHAASPVIAGNLAIVLVDSPETAYVAAYDVATGQQKWRTERPRGVLGGYATPAIWRNNDGSMQVVASGSVELTGYSATTGERVWYGPGITSYPMASPYIAGDSVYTTEPPGVGWPAFSEPLSQFDKNKDGKLSLTEAQSDPGWMGSLRGIDQNTGDNDGAVTAEEYARASASQDGGLFRVRLGGRGDISKSHVVWRNTKGIPVHSAPLLYGKALYTIRKGIVSAYDPATGSLLQEQRLPGALGDYYASPVAGDGKIYFASYEGVLSVIDASVPWRVLSTSDVGEPVLATPAIAKGRIFVRTKNRLLCFGSRLATGNSTGK